MDILSLATSVTPTRTVGFTATVIIAGLGIVLGTLAVLIVVFYAFGGIMSKSQDIKNKKAAEKLAKQMEEDAKAFASAPPKKPVAPVVPRPPVVEQGISGEVVAAISAAVYAMDGGTATIRSIKRQSPAKGRNPWAQASVVDNTRPF